MRGRRLAALACVLVGCPTAPLPEPPIPGPLGIPMAQDGRYYAGAAVLDVTPAIRETFTDLDGNHTFDGCLDDPSGTVLGCHEPFDDANGNGWFDAVWIGGFGPLRPATGVHDPISVRAVVLARDGEYVAIVALDLVGLGSPRIDDARAALAADGFDPARLLASSSHNHQGPDSMGLWGDPYDLAAPITGLDREYQARLATAIGEAVRGAAAAMEPVDLVAATVRMRDRDPYLNGAVFGGKNPAGIMHGMIFDGRDPIVVSDQLLTLQGRGEDGVVFTLTNWSGHPETRGSENNDLSADWVGKARSLLEAEYGGIALHVPESLGGMQSALGGDLPLVRDGVHVYELCTAEHVVDPADPGCFGKVEGDTRTDADGAPVPVWAERQSWDFVDSHGALIAEAAIDSLEGAMPFEGPLRFDSEALYVPILNVVYQLLGPSDIFELGLEDAIFDPILCPEADATTAGCVEVRTARLRVGPIAWLSVPGELLPELFWGFPGDDPRWADERDAPTSRGGPDARYFRQHPRECDDVAYEDCRGRMTVGDCDCLHMHAVPYRLSDAPAVGPMIDLIEPAETPIRAVIGMADSYLSYIVPEPDFNTSVSLLTDDGDHYEDTVSPGAPFATRVLAGQAAIAARW